MVAQNILTSSKLFSNVQQFYFLEFLTYFLRLDPKKNVSKTIKKNCQNLLKLKSHGVVEMELKMTKRNLITLHFS